MIDEDEVALMKIFQPFATDELIGAMRKQQKFVHYTSSPIAMSIIQSKEIWMRKISCMNDFMEVRHGLNCISKAWHSEAGNNLQKFLDYNFSGIVKRITELFDGWQQDIELNTYVTCVSKHDANEDEIGSLIAAFGSRAEVLVSTGVMVLSEVGAVSRAS